MLSFSITGRMSRAVESFSRAATAILGVESRRRLSRHSDACAEGVDDTVEVAQARCGRSALIAIIGLICFIAAFVSARLARAESPPFNFLGEQEVLVFPVRVPIPPGWQGQECAGTSTVAIADWKTKVKLFGSPRFTANQLQAKLNFSTDLEFFYNHNSYGATRFDFRVVPNLDVSDGWWTAPQTQQAYCQNGTDNFVKPGSFLRDVATVLYQSAIDRGQITMAEAHQYHRLLAVINFSGRGGQTVSRLTYPIRLVGGVPVELPFSAAFVDQDSNDDDFFAVLRHELGHELGFKAHYFNPCPRFLSAVVKECLGPWDPMGWDWAGTEFSSYSRVQAGWIADTPDNIIAIPPLILSGEKPSVDRSVALAPIEAAFDATPAFETATPQVVRIPINTDVPFIGYYVECRQQLGFDKARASGTRGMAPNAEGLAVYYVDEYHDTPKVYIERSQGLADLRFALLSPGETFVLNFASRRLEIANSGFVSVAGVRRCSTSIRQSWTGVSSDYNVSFSGPGSSGFTLSPDHSSPDVWIDSSANGFGRYAYGQAVSQIGTVRVPSGPGDAPTAGKKNKIWFRVRNNGDVPARRVRVTVSVSPLIIGESCERARQVLGVDVIPSIPAGREAIRSIAWTPRKVAVGQIQVRAISRGSERLSTDNVATRTFTSLNRVPPSRRPKASVVTTAIPLPAAYGCRNPNGLAIVPENVPADWRVSLMPETVAPRTHNVRLAIRIPANRRHARPISIGFLALHETAQEQPGPPEAAVLPLPDVHQELLGGATLFTSYAAAPRITAACLSDAHVGDEVTLAGVVRPAEIGTRVLVEYRNPRGRISTDIRTTRSGGHYASSAVVDEAGRWILHARSLGDAAHLPAVSSTCHVDVASPRA